VYTDKATREYEKAVKDAYVAAGGQMFDGPVSMSVTFTKNKITISLKQIEGESCLRGDIDNYIKSIMDGLNGVAYADDGQVLNLKAHKR
jgi:Holliday junction resolvase RusA-like endonuclease